MKIISYYNITALYSAAEYKAAIYISKLLRKFLRKYDFMIYEILLDLFQHEKNKSREVLLKISKF